MKKTLLFIIAVLLITSNQPSKAQWIPLSHNVNGDFYSLFFTSSTTGYVGGILDHKLMKTTNGGQSFIYQYSPTSYVDNDIFFINSNTGFSVGDQRTISKTTNGGLKWELVYNGSGQTLHCIYFPSENTGYAVGGNNILKSTNGGSSWNMIGTQNAYLAGVNFIDNYTGFICGNNGNIWKTINGGTSWTFQASPSSGYYEEIIFLNYNTGYIAGQYGTILKTTNGGNTWINTFNNSSIWFYDLYMLNTSTGWVCGQNGKIYRTTNGAASWEEQQTGINTSIRQLHFTNAHTGYAVGYNGKILKTTNGGAGSNVSGIFEKVVSGQLVNELTSSNFSAWGDYDNDGFQDVVISQFNDNCYTCQLPLLLFRNNGNGTFTKITNNAIANSTIAGSGLAWGDYNNDGHLDLFATGTVTSKNILFKNEGNGNFTKITTGDIVNDIAWSQTAAWADYDKDGWLDLFVTNRDAQSNFLYKNNGNGTFTKITSGSIVNDIGASRSCAWGDYNNDGWIDLFVLNFEAQSNFLYKNNGNGTFTRILNAPMVNDNQWGSSCGWVDIDNDGNLDLYIANLNGINRLYYNHGNGNFTLSNSILSQETTSHGFNWGDYDNDGKIDVVICKPGGVNNLYRNLGNSNFQKVTNEIIGQEGGYSIGAAWTDINNNGKLDLFITNRNFTNYNYLYKNVGNIGNYLVCKLKGCESNKFGIGARIKIVKDDFVAYRDITSGGNWSQNMLAAHFGVGSNTALDSVIVYWPSENVTRLSNISVNQILTIEECETNLLCFDKVTTGDITLDKLYGESSAWGDYTNNGYQDLLVTNYNNNCSSCNYPLLLYRNDNGVLTKVTNTVISNESVRAFDATWGDYDNDGWLDLFICVGDNQNNLLFKNNGDGTFTKITSGIIVNDGGWSTSCAWADINKDGWLDLYVVNQNNQNNFLYMNNGDGTFTKVINSIVSNDGAFGRSCSFGDFNNDGWLDLYVVNYDQPDFLYKNMGNGSFTLMNNAFGGTIPNGTSGSVWGDYNNDGYLDLFITVHNNKNLLYKNNGNETFSLMILLPGNDLPAHSFGCTWADLDNDGYLDLIVSNQSENNSNPGYNNYIYKNVNGQHFTKITNNASDFINYSTSVSFVDLNLNGKLDLLFANKSFFSTLNYNSLFINNCPDLGNYIVLKLKGCTYNKSAIGAKVTLIAGGKKQIREISGGCGYHSQNMMWPHFGIGSATTIDSIIVKWTTGNIQILTNVNANQVLEINECLVNITSQNSFIPDQFSLKQNYPNPFNPTTMISFDIPFHSEVKLIIYDNLGKEVVKLIDEKYEPGRYEINFNASNLPSGVYYYSLLTNSFKDTKKLVILK